jgi:hypothetical protein
MIKFLNVDSFLIALNGIVGIDQTANTTTVITYGDGLKATVTHATGTNPAFYNMLIPVVKKALSSDWTKPVYPVTSQEITAAISGIVYTHTVVPTS